MKTRANGENAAGSAAARRSPPISRRPPPLDPLAEERWILENIYVPSGGEAPYSSPLSEKPEVEFTASRAPAHRGEPRRRRFLCSSYFPEVMHLGFLDLLKYQA